MTANEIREKYKAHHPEYYFVQIEVLAEIAAQLAELNQGLRDIHPELNLPDECRKHQCDYYLSYLAYGDRSDDMSHEAYHAEAKRHLEHSKVHRNDTGADVCKTCERYEKRLRA